MDYKELITRSFRLIWKYKWLWIFGVFAAGGGGGGFGGNFNGGSPSWNSSKPEPHMDVFARNVENWVTSHIALIAGLVLALLIFIFIWIILSIISQGALIGAAERLDKDETTGFAESFKVGTANFWSILGFGLLLFLIILLPVMFIGFLVAISIAVAGPFALFGLIVLIPLLLLFIPVALAIGVISLLGMRFIVIEGNGAVAALSASWSLLRRQLGPAALTWLISVGLAIGFGIAIALAFIILLVPVGIAAYVVFSAGFTPIKLGIFVFIGLIVLAALIVVQGAYGAYRSVYWTLAFRQMRVLDSDEPQPEASA